ncbi:MAG: DHA2 family efflux MFS transporter permease subunit [Pseudonocardia sp.]|nr:DHA2 family efflux MFS transporter permease subunit [Pseudonocardia sp.]MDN5931578.1 DHA2 family efflux MFS transporter permease subunit [Pseudonocardia sp.]
MSNPSELPVGRTHDEPASTGAVTNPRRWWALAVISVAVAMVIVDATIVNVVLPTIIGELGITSAQAQWVQESYTLVFAALLLSFGRIADRVGRRRMLVWGCAVFAVASAAAALAPNGDLLVVGRMLQGIGGAMIFPATLSLLNASFRGADRNIAFAVWGATIGGTAALGPLLGGWLTTLFSWRAAFVVFVPVAIALIVAARALVTESRDPDAETGLDLTGSVLSIAAAGLLVLGLIEGRIWGWWTTTGPVEVLGQPWPWTLSPTPVVLGMALLATAAFIGWERHRNHIGAAALVDLSLFRVRSFRNGNLVTAIVYLGEFGLLFALPLWWQNVLGYSAAQTALALLPLALAAFLAGAAAAGLANRLGPLAAVRFGLGAEIVGVVGLGLVITTSTPWWATVPFLAVYGFGLGVGAAQLGSVVLADLPVARSGQGSGTSTTSQQIGAALGVAVLGLVLFATLTQNLTERLATIGIPTDQAAGIADRIQTTAGAAIRELAIDPATQAAAEQARAALATAVQATTFTAAAFLLLALLATRSLTASKNAA